MEVEGITAGVNMWALLPDNDPGDRAANLAVDDPKPKKPSAAAAAAEVEEEPPADRGGSKPAKRRTKAKNKKGAAADKQAAAAAAVADGEVQTNGRKERRPKGKEAPAPAAPSKADMSDGADAAGGGRCRAVAGRICKAAIGVALLGFWFQLASAPPVAGGLVI